MTCDPSANRRHATAHCNDKMAFRKRNRPSGTSIQGGGGEGQVFTMSAHQHRCVAEERTEGALGRHDLINIDTHTHLSLSLQERRRALSLKIEVD